jgi:UDPglucose 6-dehydrogenase
VIKSTIEPETTDIFSSTYSLKLVHNPEFLTARTAYEDFHNQQHIVLGKGANCSQNDMDILETFYSQLYPDANISHSTSLESESMKIFSNSFYASKVMLFNEYYLLCQKNGSNFEKIKEMMLKNDWINPMHTNVPGPDGSLGYGGACFPKDTNALCKYMEKKGTEKKVLEAVIEERNELR